LQSVAVVLSLSPVACETSTPPAQQPTAALTPRSTAGVASDGGSATTGKVVETMSSGGYTYVRIDDGTKKIWAAGPETTVEVGDTVSVPSGLPMKGFKSTTLGRTFDTVYFVSAIEIGGTPPAAAPAGQQKEAPHGSVPAAGSPHGGAASAKPASIDAAGVRQVEGGHTVAELFANKATLAGKPVAVRGKVAKFSSGIMGKNWVHVQDGTGDEGSNDLTVTTSGTATVGDTVVARGTLATDRDFGFGYHYDVMVEDAAVTVE
jgi:hypothetical protein